MKHRDMIILGCCTAALIAAVVFLFDPFGREGQAPVNREELTAIPGGVTYQEGETNYPELFTRAELLLSSGDFSGAEQVYRQILAKEPNNAAAYVGLGSCRLSLYDLNVAAQHYQRALELDPRSTMALLGLGSTAYAEGRYPDAVKHYRRALDLKADLPDAHWGLAISYEVLLDNRRALTHLRRFLELAPDSQQAPEAREMLARLEGAR